MSSTDNFYERFKIVAESSTKPCAVMSVEKNERGECGKIRIFAANDLFSLTGEPIEGEEYTKFLPKSLEFDDMCFRAAFNGEHFRTYVNSSGLVGGWSENVVLPLVSPEDGNTGYCQYIYEINKDMDTGKFSAVSPSIAGIIVQNCLTLKNGTNFEENLREVMENLRTVTDALSVTVVSVDNAQNKAEIIATSIRSGSIGAGQLLSRVPYDIVSVWPELIGASDSYIIRDKGDIDYLESLSPKWAGLLKSEGAQNLCMVPLYQKKEIIGYMIATDFDIAKMTEIKEIMVIMSFFLATEMSNNVFLKRLEWLTSVDLLTGVRNRGVMNRVVDELDARLKYQQIQFGVIFCVLNGLKALNDKDGHAAGNRRLERAGEILREVFDETEVFRAAGEEFAVIAEGIEVEEFNRRVKRLRELGSDINGVYFSMGYASYDDSEDLRSALRTAHKQMMHEKEEFYQAHPDMKR